MDADRREWVEQLGLWADANGMTRSVGRVLGWLLVCDPPETNAPALADGLKASSGSISAALQQLTAAGFVERVGVPGDRRTWYRIPPASLVGLLEAELPRIRAMRSLGEAGLAAIGDEPSDEAAARLHAWTDVARFFEDHWPALVEEWKQERTAGGDES